MNRTLLSALAALICVAALAGCAKSSTDTATEQQAKNEALLPVYDSTDEATPAERRQAWITEPAPQKSTVADSRVSESANKAM